MLEQLFAVAFVPRAHLQSYNVELPTITVTHCVSALADRVLLGTDIGRTMRGQNCYLTNHLARRLPYLFSIIALVPHLLYNMSDCQPDTDIMPLKFARLTGTIPIPPLPSPRILFFSLWLHTFILVCLR